MQWKRIKRAPHILRLGLPLGLILLAGGLVLSTRDLEAYHKSPYPLPPTPRFNERITLPTEATGLIDQARIPVEFKLLRGETVTQVFEKLGLQSTEARAATNALSERLNLRKLKAGNQYSAYFNPDSSLSSFELTLDGSGRVAMTRADGGVGGVGGVGGDNPGWKVDWQPFERTTRMRALRGTLDGSLDTSIRRAGGPAGLAYRMADVLQWDLDFTRDLKRGDGFELLYEEILLEGQPHAVGSVYALVYESQNRRHEAYRFGDSGTYYDGEGHPLRKMFLRSPLRYSRITSGFTTRRFHPVLKSYRPHWGVDYGAPVGTPVQVTAGGVVTFTGWDRGGGNVVKVRHAGGYVTAYLHLSKFASGVRTGSRVRQGDIIAYTGATGLASGPHLDYRVQHNGGWIDPLTLKSVRDEPIPVSQLAAFRGWRKDVLAGMQSGKLPPEIERAGRSPETRLATQVLATAQAPATLTAR